jgi:hypothetical protein
MTNTAANADRPVSEALIAIRGFVYVQSIANFAIVIALICYLIQRIAELATANVKHPRDASMVSAAKIVRTKSPQFAAIIVSIPMTIRCIVGPVTNAVPMADAA